jgi:CBS domain-containing protein
MTAIGNKTVRISDVMRKDVLKLSPDMKVVEAMKQLLDHDYSGAPVLSDEGELLGVLSRKDCLDAAINAYYNQSWGGPVSDHMTRSVEVIDWDMDLISAANQFLNSRYRRFPVMENGKLIGQISRCDVLNALGKHWS